MRLCLCFKHTNIPSVPMIVECTKSYNNTWVLFKDFNLKYANGLKIQLHHPKHLKFSNSYFTISLSEALMVTFHDQNNFWLKMRRLSVCMCVCVCIEVFHVSHQGASCSHALPNDWAVWWWLKALLLQELKVPIRLACVPTNNLSLSHTHKNGPCERREARN